MSLSKINLSLTLESLPTGELIYCIECFLNITFPEEGFQAYFHSFSLKSLQFYKDDFVTKSLSLKITFMFNN